MPIASRIALALLLPALLVNMAVFLLPMGNLALLSFRQANEGGARRCSATSSMPSWCGIPW